MEMAAEATPTPPTTSGRDGLAARDSLRGAAGATETVARGGGHGRGGDAGQPEGRDRRRGGGRRPVVANHPGPTGGMGQSSGKPLFEPEGRVHANKARSQLACGEAGWSGPDRDPSGPPRPRAPRLHQAVEIAFRSGGRRAESRPPSAQPPAQIRRDGAQGPMKQHSNRSLRTAQNLGDLGGGHLVDEAQDHRRRRSSGSAQRLARRRCRPRGRRGLADVVEAAMPLASSSGATGRRRSRRRSFATTLRAMRNRPDAECRGVERELGRGATTPPARMNESARSSNAAARSMPA